MSTWTQATNSARAARGTPPASAPSDDDQPERGVHEVPGRHRRAGRRSTATTSSRRLSDAGRRLRSPAAARACRRPSRAAIDRPWPARPRRVVGGRRRAPSTSTRRSRSLLVRQVADVGLGVLELRRPEQRVERADLDADAAVHAQREVDGEPVEHVAAARSRAARRRRPASTPCASRCRCTSPGTRGRTACRPCSSPRAARSRRGCAAAGRAATSGYCAVCARCSIVDSVVAMPCTSPPSGSPPPPCLSCRSCSGSLTAPSPRS